MHDVTVDAPGRSTNVTRLYLQVQPDEPIERWPDATIWDEILRRMTTSDGWAPNVGRIIQKGVTPMRSFVAGPMRHGRLFLAGAPRRTSSCRPEPRG